MSEQLGPEIHELQQSALETIEQVREELADEKARERRDAGLLSRIALTTAILSALAAFASLLAGSLANEALLAQIRAADAWQQFQAKSTKRHIEQSTRTLLDALGRPVPAIVIANIQQLVDDQAQIRRTAEERQRESAKALKRHESFAQAVTAFQIAISLGAISALTRRRRMWILGLMVSMFGLVSIVNASFVLSAGPGEGPAPPQRLDRR